MSLLFEELRWITVGEGVVEASSHLHPPQVRCDNSLYAQEPYEVESLTRGSVAEVRRETASPTAPRRW